MKTRSSGSKRSRKAEKIFLRRLFESGERDHIRGIAEHAAVPKGEVRMFGSKREPERISKILVHRGDKSIVSFLSSEGPGKWQQTCDFISECVSNSYESHLGVHCRIRIRLSSLSRQGRRALDASRHAPKAAGRSLIQPSTFFYATAK